MNRTTARAATALIAAATIGLAGAATASADTGEYVYTGQATITLAQYGYCGFSSQPTPVGQNTFTAPVTLVVGSPATDNGGGTEQNPIHFTLQTDQQGGTGAWSVTTGLVATTPTTGRQLAVQYWTDRYDSSTGALAATLTDDHIQESLAYNLINVEQLLIPCQPQLGTIPMVAAMGEGTQLAGTLTTSGASLEIKGASSDQLAQYDIVVSVQRASA